MEAFICCISQGMDYWVRAGEILIVMREKYSSAFDKILKAVPWLTRDNLDTFCNIGSRKLRPEVLLAKGIVSKRLLELDYEEQSRILDDGVEVAGMEKGKPTTKIKSVFRITPREARIALPAPMKHVTTTAMPETPKENLESLGFFRVTCKWGNLQVAKVPVNTVGAQKIVLTNQCFDMAAIVEILQPKGAKA